MNITISLYRFGISFITNLRSENILDEDKLLRQELRFYLTQIVKARTSFKSSFYYLLDSFYCPK